MKRKDMIEQEQSLEKEFIPYEQALALKELGFDEPCLAVFDDEKNFKVNQETRNWNDNLINGNTTSASLYQQAFRWFREKYKLYSHVRESYGFDNTLRFVTQINGTYVNHGIEDKPINRFETYEEAELECIKKLIEIVKNK
jgi:hypothetical protein